VFDLDTVACAIAAATDAPFQLRASQRCPGGCINDAVILKGVDGRTFFTKVNNRSDSLSMFTAEAEALTAIGRTGVIRVPQHITHGESDGAAFLVLEYLPMGGRGSFAGLGRSLAALHAVTSEHFGWHRDNFIGATPQKNAPVQDWPVFYRDQRLGYQIELARRNGLTLPGADKLLDNIDLLFASYRPRPSLLHGDLWIGNVSFLTSGAEPVLFDPACYFGDRECDLAFTEMFGGFPAEFYCAYQAEWPLADGYPLRKRLYNLYHELNHYNLFGGGYAGQVRNTIASLCAQL
jgi:fructosamine-3-kinase